MNGAIDLTKVLQKKHADKWVALSRDHKRVVGYSNDLMRLVKRAGRTKVVYMKVPASGRTRAF